MDFLVMQTLTFPVEERWTFLVEERCDESPK